MSFSSLALCLWMMLIPKRTAHVTIRWCLISVLVIVTGFSDYITQASSNAGPLPRCHASLDDATSKRPFHRTRSLYLLWPGHLRPTQSPCDVLRRWKSTSGFRRMEDGFRASMTHWCLAADEVVHSCCANPPVITSSYWYYNQPNTWSLIISQSPRLYVSSVSVRLPKRVEHTWKSGTFFPQFYYPPPSKLRNPP